MRRSSKKPIATALVVAAAVIIALAVAIARTDRVGYWRNLVGGRGGYRVIDGDTIKMDGVGSVRYIGIDAPERGEPYYGEARRYNKELLARGAIRLEYGRARFDRYGRTLAYVYVRDAAGGTIFVNEELVRAGWAVPLEIPPDVEFAAAFRRAEEEARREGRGMWAAGGARN
jgi:micrococcal nuclease